MGAAREEGGVKSARKLRRRTTDAERKLWAALRDRRLDGHKFVRQLPIGPYIADFACREANLIIEADGGQHADSAYDEARTRALLDFGYRVVPFWNNDILTNLDGVLQAIALELANPPSPPRFAVGSPLPSGERDRVRGPFEKTPREPSAQSPEIDR